MGSNPDILQQNTDTLQRTDKALSETDTLLNEAENSGALTSSTSENGAPMTLDEIEADENRMRADKGLPSLDDSANLPINTQPDYFESLRTKIENGATLDWNGFIDDLYGLGQSALYGLGSGAQETARTGLDLSNELGKLLNIGPNFQTENQQSDAMTEDFKAAIPNIAELLGIPKPDSTLENIVGTLTPMVASYLVGGKALEGLGVVSKLSSLEIPGVIGQGLARYGVTGTNTGKTLLEMLKGAVAMGSVMPEDSDNFADMLKGFSSRSDLLGSVSRAWIEHVPGVEALAKDEGDSPLTKRFKNALDAAYGEIAGPIVYLVARNAKIGSLFAKGLASAEDVAKASKDQELIQQVIEKLGNDTSNETALKYLFPDGEPGAIDGAVTTSDLPTKQTGKRSFSTGVQQTVDNVNLDATAGPSEAQVAAAESGVPMDATSKLKEMLNWSPDETLKRIQDAQNQATAAERAHLSEIQNYTKRYDTLIQRTGDVVDRQVFDQEAYLKHLTASVDDPAKFQQALNDWPSFMEVPEGSSPSLLTPKQVAAWNNTPMDVTGNIIDTVKRLTTTNQARKDDAIKWLAEQMGNGFDKDNQSLAKSMLGDTGKASAEVDNASALLVRNTAFLQNSIVPDLDKVLHVLGSAPDDVEMQRTALQLIKNVNSFTEANKNLKSAAGRLLQSSQIDPKLEASLREIYGPQQYREYFNPGSKVAEAVAEPAVNSAAALASETVDTARPLSASERAQIQMIQSRWATLQPGERANFASSVYRAGSHPVWKYIGGAGNLGIELMSNLTMSGMLFHPATWNRVLQGAFTANVYDAAAQGLASRYLKGAAQAAETGGVFNIRGKLYESVFRGAPIDATTHEIMEFGAKWRLLSLPYSLLVAGKAFVRPGWQEVYGLGSTLYKSSPILGPEMIERSFGKDFATRVFTSGGGVPGRVLRGVGMGLGFPQHVLGSIETMINHSALSSRVAEELYAKGLGKGLKGKEAVNYVFDHITDVLDDAIVAKSVPRGNIALRNRAQFSADDLRNITEQAGSNADYSSLRESGLQSQSPLATTKLGDTVPFQLERAISKGISSIPVVGPLARSVTIPFGRVSANMLHRAISPVQAILSMATRAADVPGFPSKYIDEVLGGLHGPHRQAQLLGHTALSSALFSLGVLNMANIRNSGKDVTYPLGSDSEREATNERGVRYGESLLPDGSSVTTLGLNPFINAYNQGNYASWILGTYGLKPFLNGASSVGDMLNMDTIGQSDAIDASEGWQHLGQWLGSSAPVAPFFQGLKEIYSSVSNSDDPSKVLENVGSGVASAIGNAIERPLRLGDLLPGKQVAGRSSSVRDDGIGRAFRTGAGGFSSDPNMDRINAYDLSGTILPDKYDPDKGVDQYLEAFGFPSYRAYDTSPLNQFMGELESHDIVFTPQNKKQNIKIGGNPDPVPVNLQHFYNPKTKQHLWDVYNKFLSEQRTTSWVVTNHSGKELTVREALDELASETLKAERGEGASKVVRIGNYQKRILSDAAANMQVNLAVMQSMAKDQLEAYLAEHAKEYVDKDGNNLEQYGELMYNVIRPPLPTQQDLPTDQQNPGVGSTPTIEESP